MTLESSTEARRQSALTALEETYQKDLVEHENEEKDAIGIGAGYRTVTTTARRAWEEYRQAWVGLVITLPLSDMRPSEATQAIETLLALERVDELKHNILGIY